MGIRVRQVYAPVFFLCFFFVQRQNVLIWIKVYTFRLWQQNLLKRITTTKKASTLRDGKDGKLIDLAKLNSYDLFSRQKYH